MREYVLCINGKFGASGSSCSVIRQLKAQAMLSQESNKAVSSYLKQSFHRFKNVELSQDFAETYFSQGMNSALNMVDRVRGELGDNFKPKAILEIGCAGGFNCFALSERFPEAKIYGVEPEKSGVELGQLLTDELNVSGKVSIKQGFGEELPYADGFFDLIICHTVIEHVQNVDAVITEVARVLSPKGVFHIEAPNYVFPYEPHLRIVTIPLLGKKFVAFTSLLQGKGSQNGYLGHLQFVTPFWLEKLFNNLSLEYENRALAKLKLAASGKTKIMKFKLLANMLRAMAYLKLTKPAIWLVSTIGFYPSVMYTVRRKTSSPHHT